MHRGELHKEREWVKQGGGHHQGKPLTASRTRHCSVRSSRDGSSQPVALQLFQVEPLKLPPSPILLHAALSYQIKKVSIIAKILLLSYWEQLSWESLYKTPHQQASSGVAMLDLLLPLQIFHTTEIQTIWKLSMSGVTGSRKLYV